MNLRKIFLTGILMLTASSTPHAEAHDLPFFIGGYTKDPEHGISIASFNTHSGKVSGLRTVAATPSPTFLAVHPNHKYLYAVNEKGAVAGEDIGGISAFEIGAKAGTLKPLNAVAAGGGLCHLSIDATGKFLLAAAYTGGSFEVWALKENGEIGERVQFIQHSAERVEGQKPEKPHGHQFIVSPDNRYAFAVDLGLDKVFIFHFDSKTGKVTPAEPAFASLVPGAGPRHMTFSTDARFAYVINEHGNTVASFNYQEGKLEPLQTISTLPEDHEGKNYTAEIAVHPNGKYLYGSNRGRDSIAVFAIDQQSGRLTLTGEASTDGRFPRHFSLTPDGNWLLAVNQNDSSLIAYQVDAATGQLTKKSMQENLPGAPVCVIFH